eukprot:scaffold45621_cov56-Attheya_sp.AAC.2
MKLESRREISRLWNAEEYGLARGMEDGAYMYRRCVCILFPISVHKACLPRGPRPVLLDLIDHRRLYMAGRREEYSLVIHH